MPVDTINKRKSIYSGIPIMMIMMGLPNANGVLGFDDRSMSSYMYPLDPEISFKKDSTAETFFGDIDTTAESCQGDQVHQYSIEPFHDGLKSAWFFRCDLILKERGPAYKYRKPMRG